MDFASDSLWQMSNAEVKEIGEVLEENEMTSNEDIQEL